MDSDNCSLEIEKGQRAVTSSEGKSDESPKSSANVENGLKNKNMVCSRKCQKGTLFLFSVVFLVFGIVLALTWHNIYNNIVKTELSLENENTQQFKFWKETPIPMFLEIYLFNWTNAADFKAGEPWTKKPKFQQLGPYTFKEHHSRVNIKYNDNNTVNFNTVRTWHFVPEKTVGSLDDNITTLNAIALTVGNIVKHKSLIIRRGVNFLLEEKRVELTVTKTAKEFLFEGYNDTLLTLLKKIHLKGIDIPFDKFGWFYNRNGSSTYDGNFTMYTGADDIQKLGIITRWNQSPRSPEYPGYCGMVNGTSGELWYPLKDAEKVSIFTPDTCSTLTLEANGTYSTFGVEGKLFAQTERLFDNGTKYQEMDCFSPGVHLPTGVRNVSQCKFGAPAFMSMPHFYMADPSYLNAVEGLRPDPSNHNFYLALEPNTGLPLKVHASLQVSLYLERIKGISIFENVNTTMMPVLWFRQEAAITENLADLAKTLILLPSIGTYTAYGVIGLGCLLLLIGSFITVRQGWRGTEDEEPLTQNHL
ncbi:protein croquemort-like isoform X2 [Coccinella septempunctata]|uniref:protein croquemort-like isoform X2 n=1 Tax=Coccinella septempunctata TaxID=41139 RepID=UPI001D090474|nr:protein croquemort-like isoform X2 [Coccinella septempunctata]